MVRNAGNLSAFFYLFQVHISLILIFAKRHVLIPLPKEFVERIIGDPFWSNEIIPALNSEPPVSIRLNPEKEKPEFDLIEQVLWCQNGYYLDKRPLFTLDPLFHSGSYYPQEAGSMFIEYLFNQLSISKKSCVLDLCAAPGGKSTLISSILDEDGFLVCNEIIPNRNSILRENLVKWGSANVVVTGNLPNHFQRVPSLFDVILLDAPCSGEGMFRKDIESRNEWSKSHVEMCASRQRQIVSDVWDSLKEDGYLIYSTCTLNQFENEGNVHWILENLDAELVPLKISLPIIAGRENVGSYFVPGLTKSEGFYCAVLRKRVASNKRIRFRPVLKRLKGDSFRRFEEFLDVSELSLIEYKKGISGFLGKHIELIEILNNNLNCTKIGVALGSIFPKKIEPNHELAMSNLIAIDINEIEVSKEEALRYLKGDIFSIESESKGYQLVTFQKQRLGWINNLGNRFNNMYPNEWRIRMRID